MSHNLPPAGFEPPDRKSPLTAPWEPIYGNAQGAWVVLGVEVRAAHTNSRGLVHGGLVAALLDNVMGLACSKVLQAGSYVTVRRLIPTTVPVEATPPGWFAHILLTGTTARGIAPLRASPLRGRVDFPQPAVHGGSLLRQSDAI